MFIPENNFRLARSAYLRRKRYARKLSSHKYLQKWRFLKGIFARIFIFLRIAQKIPSPIVNLSKVLFCISICLSKTGRFVVTYERHLLLCFAHAMIRRVDSFVAGS